MNTSSNEDVLLKGVLAVFGAKDPQPFLIEGGGDETVDFLRTTMDEKMNAHFDSIGLKVLKIKDDNFISALGDNMFPLCGNYYSYASKALLRGKESQPEENSNGEFVLSNISYAEIFDYEGGVVRLELSQEIE